MTNDQEKLKGMIDNLARVYYEERGELDAVLPVSALQLKVMFPDARGGGFCLYQVDTPYGSVPVVVDRECPPDKMYLIQADSYFNKKG